MTTETGRATGGEAAAPHPVIAWLIVLFAVFCLAAAPPSRLGPSTLEEWQDQRFFLRAVTQTIEQGLPDEETRFMVGQGYVALALAVHRVSGLSPGEALILLARLSFAASALILAALAMRYRIQASLGFQLALALAAVFALITSVWFRVTDIPWTHFTAATLLGAIVLVSLTRLPLALRAGLIGFLAVVLLQTRLFEGQVTAIAGLILAPLAAARYWTDLRARLGNALLQCALPFVVGGVVAFSAVGILSHNWSMFQQYGDQQGMVLTPQLAPIKAVQLFWDPCFATVCDFAPSPTVSPLADSLAAWRQPLLLQLPGLIGAAVGLLTLLALRPRRFLKLPLGIIFAMVAAGGMIVAYLSGAPSGSPHLKYGFFRDFVPPLMLLSCAFIGALAVQRAEDGRTSAALVVPLAAFFVVVLAFTGLRAVGLPELAQTHLARLEVASACAGTDCRFAVAAIGTSGEALPYSDLAYVTCDAKPLAPAVQRVSELRVDASACASVAIVPLASGLLYTPEDDLFLNDPLDLSLPADRVSIPTPPG